MVFVKASKRSPALRVRGESEKLQEKLLDVQHGERLDIGGNQSSGSMTPEVGVVYRHIPTDGRCLVP